MLFAQTDPEIPTFPENWRLFLEMSDVMTMTTSMNVEVHDYTNNRLRIDVLNEGGTTIHIYEFDDNLHHTIDMESFTCETAWLNDTDTTGLVDDFGHLVNSSAFLYFGDNLGYMFNRTDVARDINCNVWRKEYSFTYDGFQENGTIDYYFSVPEWTVHGGVPMSGGSGETVMPVRARVVGTRYNETSGEALEPVNHNYEFSYFSAQDPYEWDFQLPYWIGCNHVADVPFPPALPDEWESAIEYTDTEQQLTGTIYQWYDGAAQRERMDFTYNGTEFKQVIDYGVNKTYTVMDGECHVEHTPGVLLPSADMFYWGPQYQEQYRYLGRHTVRGIPCDRWRATITPSDGVTLTLDWSFAQPGWNMRGNGADYHSVPVELQARVGNATGDGSEVLMQYHFVHFVPSTPSWRVFHLSDRYLCGWAEPPAPDRFPEFPAAFSVAARVSGSVWREGATESFGNFTAAWQLYYDADANRTRVDYRRKDYEFVDLILLDQQLFVQAQDGDCQIYDMRRANFSIVHALVDHYHLRDPADLFDFGDQYEEQYQGLRWAGDVLCDAWSSERDEVVEINGARTRVERTLVFYWASEWWDIADNDEAAAHRVPFRILTEARYTDMGTGDVAFAFYEMDLSDFRRGAPPPETWIPPPHLYCYSDRPERMPDLSPIYEANVQFAITNRGYAGELSEWVDTEAGLFRFEQRTPDAHHASIWDFGRDFVARFIDVGGQRNCTVIKASETSFGESGMFRNISDFFAISEDVPEDFAGERVVRGIVCQLWTRPMFNLVRGDVVSNYVIEHYFSAPEFRLATHNYCRTCTTSVPVRITVRGHHFNLVTNDFQLFDHTYDFSRFLEHVEPESFEVPRHWNCPGFAYEQASNVGDNSDSEIDIVRWMLLQGFLVVVFGACCVLGALFGGFFVFLSSNRALMRRAKRFAEAKLEAVKEKSAHTANINDLNDVADEEYESEEL